MAQVKARMDREAEEPEAAVGATLEDDSATKAAATTPAGKSKKKKKKAKKSAADALLDLDMDNDDASKQTRFAGTVRQSTEVTQDAVQAVNSDTTGETAANQKPSPRHSKKRRSSGAKASTVQRVAGLSALAEVDEEESDSDDEDSSSDGGGEGAADEEAKE